MKSLRNAFMALVAILGILFGVYRYGKRVQTEESAVADLKETLETKERIENVEASPDSDAAIERLRSNGWVR